MPDKTGRLTPQERTFIDAMASTGDPVYAATKAGYAHVHARAHDNMKKPAIIEGVRRKQLARLNNEILPKAVDFLEDTLDNKRETTRNRLEVVKIVTKLTFGEADASERKALHEMSAAEIQEELARLRAEAADRARPVIEHDEARDVHIPSAFD